MNPAEEKAAQEILGRPSMSGREPVTESVTCSADTCGEQVGITQTSVEFLRLMNRVRMSEGIEPKGKSQSFLCSRHYAEHKAKLEAQHRADADHDTEMWKLWIGRDMTDEQLIASARDRETMRSMMARVKAQGGPAAKKNNKLARRKEVEAE